MGQRLVNARLAAPFCCLRFEERVLSLALFPSAPGDGSAGRGVEESAAGAVGELGVGRDVSLSIAPQSGELRAQCSEHERQRA